MGPVTLEEDLNNSLWNTATLRINFGEVEQQWNSDILRLRESTVQNPVRLVYILLDFSISEEVHATD
jgi:hypothetical protein